MNRPKINESPIAWTIDNLIETVLKQNQEIETLKFELNDKVRTAWIDRIIEETGSNNVLDIYFNGKKWVVEYKTDLPNDEFEFFDDLYGYLNL